MCYVLPYLSSGNYVRISCLKLKFIFIYVDLTYLIFNMVTPTCTYLKREFQICKAIFQNKILYIKYMLKRIITV